MPRGQNAFFRIYNMARRIPRGRVASYGQIAALIGSPRSARVVGWALRSLPETASVPWWRVINSEGRISIENMNTPKEQQVRLLRAEGVDVTLRDGNYWLDLKKYLWSPTIDPK